MNTLFTYPYGSFFSPSHTYKVVSKKASENIKTKESNKVKKIKTKENNSEKMSSGSFVFCGKKRSCRRRFPETGCLISHFVIDRQNTVHKYQGQPHLATAVK